MSQRSGSGYVSFILIGAAAITMIYWARVLKKMTKDQKPKYTIRDQEAKNWVYDLIKGEKEFVFVADVPGPEDKITVRLIEAIAEIVGMPPIEPDEKWAVTVCKLQKGKDKWELVKLKEDSELKHECLDEHIVSLKVDNYQIDDDKHWSFLVDEHVNKAMEI